MLNQNDLIYSHPEFDGESPYRSNEDCEWLIECSTNQRIKIDFTFVSLEYENKCNYDRITVYDGPDEYSARKAQLCGSDVSIGELLFARDQPDWAVLVGSCQSDCYSAWSRGSLFMRQRCCRCQSPSITISCFPNFIAPSTRQLLMWRAQISKKHSGIISSGESMLIVFKSDDSINSRGFSLVYTAIETGEDEPVAITDLKGTKYGQSS